MKSLKILQEECTEIQHKIGSLLSEHARYDHSVKNSPEMISVVSSLRQNLASVQRELRERLSA